MNAYLLLFYNIAALILAVSSGIKLYGIVVADDVAQAAAINGTALPLLICLLGAAGGAVHGIASIGYHQGKGDFDPGWTGFYLSRPFLGVGMALTTYFVLVSGVGGFDVKRPLALMAWALLAGLYSQSALDKLKEIFATLFRTQAGTAGSPPRNVAPPAGGGAGPVAPPAPPAFPVVPPPGPVQP